MQVLSGNLSYAFLTRKFVQIVSLPKTIRANCGGKGQAENRSLGSKQEFVFVISVWEFYTDTISTAFAVLTDFVIESKKHSALFHVHDELEHISTSENLLTET